MIDLLGAVIKRLKNNFTYPVYDEAMEQGVEKPCFFVDITDIEQGSIANGYKQTVPDVIVTFVPAEEDPKTQMYTTSMALSDAFDFSLQVTDDISLPITSKTYSIIDGEVVELMLSFLYVEERPDTDTSPEMDTLIVNTELQE